MAEYKTYRNLRSAASTKQKFLVGHEEELFREYYLTMGTARSMNKMVSYCAVQGWLNPITHKPPIRMGIWFSMWRWALRKENQELAYEMYNKAMMDNGNFCTKEQWKQLLAERAEVCFKYQKHFYAAWKEENGIA